MSTTPRLSLPRALTLLLVLSVEPCSAQEGLQGELARLVDLVDPGERRAAVSQLALSALRYARRRFNVDENRIYCTGVSCGGHMVWDLALRHPDRFAAIVPMIGGPRILRANGQNNLRYLENIAHLSILDFQGSKDDKYLVANVRLAFQQLVALGSDHANLVEFPELGHAFDMGKVDWAEFFGARRRDSVPDRVVRMAAEPEESCSFWVELTEVDTSRVKVVPKIPTSAQFETLDEMGQRRYVAAGTGQRRVLGRFSPILPSG